MQKREPTMPRLSLKVIGNHLCRCNNSGSLAHVCEFPTFSNYKIRITLLIFPKCRDWILPIIRKDTTFYGSCQ